MFLSAIKENIKLLIGYLVLLIVGLAIVQTNYKFELQVATNQYASDTLDPIFLVITKFAEGWMTIPVLILLAIKNWRKAVFLGISYGITALIAQSIKLFAFTTNQRPYGLGEFRYLKGYHWIKDYPMPTGGSFPSGHTTTAFCFAIGLSLLIKNKNYSFLFLLMASLVGFSRTLLSFHFASDVVGGAFLGGVTTFILFVMLKKPLKLNA